MYTNQAFHHHDETNLSHLFGAIWKNKIKIMIFVLLCTFAAFIIASLSETQYRSTAQILLESQETSFTQPTSGNNFNQQAIDELAIISQIQVLSSRDLAEIVIKRLDLYNIDEFNKGKSRQSTLSYLMSLISPAKKELSVDEKDKVYREFAQKLTAYQIDGSRVIGVSFSSRDPERAANIVNEVVRAYLEFSQNNVRDNTRNASLWLEDQIEDLRGKVEAAEGKVAKFRADADLMVGLNNASISSQRLSEISTQLTRAEAERAEAKARSEQIRSIVRSGGSLVALPEVINSPLIQRLQEQQIGLQARIAELSATLLPGHPRIRELNAQSSDLSSQIKTEALRVARSYENEANIAKARAQSLKGNLSEVKAESARVNEAEVELRALEREARSQRDLLEAYLTRYREAVGRENTDNIRPDARIIQQANPNFKAVFPNTPMIVVATLIGSTILAIVFALSSVLLSQEKQQYNLIPPTNPWTPNGLNNTSQYNHINHAQPVAPIGSEGQEPNGEAAENVKKMHDIQALSVTDTRSLRRLSHLLRQKRYKRVAVMAVNEAYSASDVTASIARAQALENEPIVLIEAGLGKEQLNETRMERAGRGLKPGLSELLNGRASFKDCIHLDVLSPLHVVPMGNAKHPGLEKLASDDMRHVFEALSNTYRRIFIDTGTMGEKALAMIARSDVCLIVTRPQVAKKEIEKAKRAVETLTDPSRVLLVEAPSWFDDNDDSYAA